MDRTLRFACSLALALAATPALASGEGTPRFTARVVFTNFGTAQLAGDGDTDAWFAGKVDAYLTVRGWEGFTLDLQPEYTYGRNPNGSGNGALLPVNTAAAFPINNKADFDMALSVSQRIDNATLTIGKINMVTRAAATPILGGGGREGFQALQLAAPVSFNTPPMVLGGLLVVPTARAQVVIGLWDAQDATNRTDLHDAFQNGVSGFATVTLRKPWRGRMGFHSFTVGGTTERSLDLRSIPELIFPPGTGGATPSQREGGWQVRYAFQQFVRQDPAQPLRGWGVFGYASLWDGNPTLGRWSMGLGVAGNPSFTAARPDDRFGIGYYRFAPSSTLKRGLAPVFSVGDEQGLELFYTFAFSAHFLLTANVQFIDPAPGGYANDVFAGLRTNIQF
ncbi:carbohydrate porin [Lysobacter sp. KIS68-7]|uniref:carbohydrate porin n=1 Tax=Lysobacter sp. KIS68-7 TaxID=2904252 RepID=UPI001E57C693|nr:carbohydrate porin [Lysobacter sp. KIS68-7]UHQ19855.1 carbohydrate porin [Lysobacter sp. KIS68-7]